MDIVDKINMYSYSTETKMDMLTLLEIAVFMDEDFDRIDEAFDFLGKLEGLASKMGIHASSSRGGLIGILWRSGKVLAEFFWNILKAVAGDKDAKERAIELSKTEVRKEDIIDFLLRVDGLTLHTLTGPIHFIDNLTGWHIWAAVETHVHDFADKAAKAIGALADVVKEVDDEIKIKAKKLLHGIVQVLGLSDEHKIVQAI